MSLPSRAVAARAATHLRDMMEHARLLETYADDILRGNPSRLDVLCADIDRGVPKLLHSLADMADLPDLGLRFHSFFQNVSFLLTPWIAIRDPEGVPDRAAVFSAANNIAAFRGQIEFSLRVWQRYADTGEAPDGPSPAPHAPEVV